MRLVQATLFPLYDFHVAVERIAAVAQVARGLPFPFVLTARMISQSHEYHHAESQNRTPHLQQ